LILLISAGVVFAPGCRWFAPKRLSEAERRGLASRSREWIEGAGGSRVWVDAPAWTNFPPTEPDTPTTAVVAAEVYPLVLSVLQKQSKREGLEFNTRETRGRQGYRVADIRLARQGELVCRWRLREVRRLLRAAIVIDDLGQDLPAAERLLALPYPLTLSVLPMLRYSTQTAEEAHRAGREVMLHLPMEPQPGEHPSPGKGEIRTGMDSREVERVIEADLQTVPYAVGVNNHMGSRATTQFPLMVAVMAALGERRLYFVDSRTTAASVALQAARSRTVPAFYRSVFLDDTETVPYTLGQLRKFRRLVEQQSVSLAIGHPHPSTIAALAQFLPDLERDDILLVPPSELVRLPEVARLQPPREVQP
jgi:hypothetical protein